MRETQTHKYGMINNVRYMVERAAQSVPSVIVLTVAQALIALGISLAELFVTPALLEEIERHAPLCRLFIIIGGFAAGIMLLRALAAYVDMNVLAGRVELRQNIIYDMVRKCASCSYPLMEDEKVQSRWAKAWECLCSNNQAAEAVWETLRELIRSVLGFVVYLFLLKDMNLFLILVTLCTTVCGCLVTNYMGGWAYRHRAEEADILKKLYYVQERGTDRLFAKDVRIFGMEEWIAGLMDKYIRLLVDFHAKGERKYLLADMADIALAFLRNAIAYGYLLTVTLQGGLSAARFLLLFTAVGGFTDWVSKIMTQVTVLHRQSLELTNVREFLDLEEVFRMEGGIVPAVTADMPCTIELRDVTFCYPGADRPVLEHINLTIPAGEKLAVVGLNGAGKTTLVKLICGFYDPTQGEVLLNGTNIKVFNRQAYYRLFAGVFQDFSVLAGSVLANIAQTTQEADRERASACLAQAGLAEKIWSLPEGMDSLLDRSVFNDAIGLSGGEMQRLMLARLLYRDSPVIVLDEPTAALDAIAESDIYNKYQELTRGRTSVYISHRLASTGFCDRVILLKDGGIAETGSHAQLMEQGGYYAELYEMQSRYYREEEKC